MSGQLDLTVKNVKCAGCVSAIQDGLTVMDGVDAVTVDIDSGNIKISGQQLNRQAIADKLAELGYPPA